MPWALQGLRRGILTSRWPKRRDEYFDTWVGVPQPVLQPTGGDSPLSVEDFSFCPTGAITVNAGQPRLDRGLCIGCGRCVELRPDLWEWHVGADVAAAGRRQLVVPEDEGSEEEMQRVRAALATRTRTFGRSVHIRHVDAGSDGAEEWEIAALLNPVYDIHRLGLFFTASPRHADVLMVTGAGAAGMVAPLLRTRDAMPDPVVVIAIGTDACSGGLWSDSYATRGGICEFSAVDVWVPGSPPSPFAILHGLLLALAQLPDAGKRA